MGWDSLSASDRVPYPGLECERIHYVVRLEAQGLPTHRFSTRPQLATAAAADAPAASSTVADAHADLGQLDWAWAPSLDLLRALDTRASRVPDTPDAAARIGESRNLASRDVATLGRRGTGGLTPSMSTPAIMSTKPMVGPTATMATGATGGGSGVVPHDAGAYGYGAPVHVVTPNYAPYKASPLHTSTSMPHTHAPGRPVRGGERHAAHGAVSTGALRPSAMRDSAGAAALPMGVTMGLTSWKEWAEYGRMVQHADAMGMR